MNSKYSLGVYSQGAGWGLRDGKLLRGNIRDKGGSWLKQPSRILAEDRPGRSDFRGWGPY